MLIFCSVEFIAIFIVSHTGLPVNSHSSEASTDHRLHGGAGDHELHLLSQHGGRCLLLDQVISPVDLQLGLQVSGRVEVFAVLSCAAALRGENKVDGREVGRGRERHTHEVINSLVGKLQVSDQQNDLKSSSFDYKPDDEQVACLPKDVTDMWASILTKTPKHQALEGSIHIYRE